MRSYIVFVSLGLFLLLSCDHDENIIEEEELFVKLYGDAGTERGVDAIETSEGYLLIGSSNSPEILGREARIGESDFYILFVDRGGNPIRRMVAGHEELDAEDEPIATRDIPSQVISTSDGGYLVVGTTTFAYMLGGTLVSQSDIFLVKVSGSGELEFQARHGALEYTDEDGSEKLANERGVSVAEVSDGYFILATTTQVDREKEGAGSVGVDPNDDVSDVLLIKVSKEVERENNEDRLVVLTREVYGYNGEDVAVSMVPVGEELAFIGRTDRESEESGGGNTNILFVLTENRGFIQSARVIGGAGDEVPYRLHKRAGGNSFYVVGENTVAGNVSAFLMEVAGASVQRMVSTIGPGGLDVVGYDAALRANDNGYWIAGNVLKKREDGATIDTDMLLMRIDFQGAIDESYGDSSFGGSNYGGVENDEIRRVIRLAAGDLLLFGTVGFEGGSTMMCLMKISAEGLLQK